MNFNQETLSSVKALKELKLLIALNALVLILIKTNALILTQNDQVNAFKQSHQTGQTQSSGAQTSAANQLDRLTSISATLLLVQMFSGGTSKLKFNEFQTSGQQQATQFDNSNTMLGCLKGHLKK